MVQSLCAAVEILEMETITNIRQNANIQYSTVALLSLSSFKIPLRNTVAIKSISYLVASGSLILLCSTITFITCVL